MSKKIRKKTLRRGDICTYHHVIVVISRYANKDKAWCEVVADSPNGLNDGVGVRLSNPINPLYHNRFWILPINTVSLKERRNTPATHQHILDNYDNYISMPALPFTLK